MKIRVKVSAAAAVILLFAGCVAYRIPYLSLDLKSVYDTSDITVYYTYVCEYDDQRCVYSLWDKADASSMVFGEDKVMPQTGTLDFSTLNLGEGDYRLDFSVYSEKNGESSRLEFLSESYDFSIDFP